MPVTSAALTVYAHDAFQTSYTTNSSVTPAANKVQIVHVLNTIRTGTGPNVPTLSGCGLTFTQINGLAPNGVDRLTVFRAISSSPTTGQITADFAGQEQKSCSIIITELTGCSTSSSGANSIVQSTTGSSSGTISSISTTLGAFGSANNATMGIIGLNRGITVTPGSGFADAGNTGGGTSSLQVEFRSDNDTTVDASFSSGTTQAMIVALEIRAEISSASPSASASLSASPSPTPSSSPSQTPSSSQSPSSSNSPSLSPSASVSPSPVENTFSVDFVCISFITLYEAKYSVRGTSYSAKYAIKNTVYVPKYQSKNGEC